MSYLEALNKSWI